MSRKPSTGGALAAVLGMLVLAGCQESGIDQSRLSRERRVAEQYNVGLHVDLSAMERRPTNLFVQDVVVGDGARADSGDVVAVNYIGWLPDGTEFDSNQDPENPFRTALGYGRVIQGWDQGVVGMRVGGERRLVIPPVMAYGAQGTGPIPSYSTLVFDVKLVDVVNRVPEGGQAADSTGGP